MNKNLFICLACCLLLWIVVPFSVEAKGNEYNVTQFGANGTDTLDDYEGIQAALDMGRGNKNPITVIIPPGTYYLDERDLHIYSYTTLKADGATIKRKTGNTSVFIKNWPDDKDSKSHGHYSCATNITIQGGTWDGNAETSTPSNLFYFFHAKNINISNVTIENCRGHHFIEFAGVKDSTISNCTFRNFQRLSGVNYAVKDDDETTSEIPSDFDGEVSVVSEAVQLDFCAKSTSRGSEPYDGTASKNIKVSGCKFINCLSGIGNHHNDKRSSNWHFENNTFTDMGFACFIVENAEDVTISGNKATGTPYFIEINDLSAQNVLVNNNKVENSKISPYSGIKLTRTKGVNITNNTISGYKYGILALSSNATVTGNTISNCSVYGIRFTEKSNSAGGIKYNTVSNMKESGIGVKDFKGDIIGNETTDFGIYGIKATGSGSGIIEDNTYDKSFSILNSSKLTTRSNKYLRDGIIVPDPDYYTIYYHKDEKSEAAKKTTVAKKDKKVRTLTIQELGFSVAGKRFNGWKAYRTDTWQWRVANNKGEDGWEDAPAAGYTYYLHKEAHSFNNAIRTGAELHLYATWKSVGKDKLEVLNAKADFKTVSKGSKQFFTVTTEKDAKYLFVMGGDNIIKTWDAKTDSTLQNGKRIWKDLTIVLNDEKEYMWHFRTGKTRKKPVSNKYFVFFNVEDVSASAKDWGKPTYTWSKDYSKITAKCVSKSDKSKKLVESECTYSRIVKMPTMSTAGEIKYTSFDFSNKVFKTQSKIVKLPKIKASYKDSSGKYTIRNDMTAIYTAPASKSVKTVTIPETITVSGVEIRVVGIGSKAFSGCKKLKEVTIASTKITDKDVNKDAFKGMSAKAVIKCPRDKLKKYSAIFVKRGAKKGAIKKVG